jgi:predicted nucleic acid-binding protein
VSQVVVDTSVVYKWFVSLGQDALDAATELLSAHLEGEVSLVAPASLPLELANGLRHSPVAEADVLEMVASFDLAHIEMIELASRLLLDATRLAYRHGITVYDAVFLALAEELDCPLATADRNAFAGIEGGVEIRLM